MPRQCSSHYAHNLTSVNSLTRDGSVPSTVSSEGTRSGSRCVLFNITTRFFLFCCRRDESADFPSALRSVLASSSISVSVLQPLTFTVQIHPHQHRIRQHRQENLPIKSAACYRNSRQTQLKQLAGEPEQLQIQMFASGARGKQKRVNLRLPFARLQNAAPYEK